jgi:hypothetical protein
MKAFVTKVVSVEAVGDTLSIVKVEGVEEGLVANRHENGNFRWHVDQWCVYIPEGATVPQDVLEENGYWEKGAKKGLLGGGSKNNRVKGRVFAKNEDGSGGYPSRGLIFHVNTTFANHANWINRSSLSTPENPLGACGVALGDDVTEFFGITFA